MRIREVQVRCYRRFIEPITVKFEDGLNVIYGPNESGKSTLAEAIWHGLTMPTKGNTASHRSMQSRSVGDHPEIRIVLESGDETLSIAKRFDDSENTRLLVERGGRRVRELTGVGAEEELRRTLGIGETVRGNLKEDAQGLWALTWVRHDESHVEPSQRINEAMRETMRDQLSVLTGETLAGDIGSAILRALDPLYDDYFTPTGNLTSKEGAPLHEAKSKLAAAQARAKELKERIDRQEHHAETVAREERKITEARAALPEARERLRLAQAALEEHDRHVEQLNEKRKTARTVGQQRTLLEQELERRGALEDKIRAQTDEAERLATELGERKTVIEQVASDLRSREQALEDEKSAHSDAQGALRRTRQLLTLVEARREQSELQAQLDAIREKREEIDELEHTLEADPATGERGDAVDAAKGALDRAKTQLKASTASIIVSSEDATAVEIDGERVDIEPDAPTRRVVTRPTTVRAGELEIRVEPGKHELSELEAAVDRAEQQLRDALDALGARNVEAARSLVTARRDSEQRLKLLRSQLKAQATQSPESLERRLESAKAEESRAERLLGELDEDERSADPSALRQSLRTLEEAVDAREEAVEQAREAVSAARRDHETETQRVERLRNNRAQALKLAAEARDELENLRSERSDLAVEQDRKEAEERFEALSEALAATEASLDATERDSLARRVDDARRALELLEEGIDSAREERDRARGALASQDEENLHARLDESEGTAELAAEEVARHERRAAAVALLRETLLRHKRENERRFRRPMEKELERLLHILFGTGRIELGDQFDVARVVRGTQADEFEELSRGATEQIAVLTRLAMARVVAKERPMPLLLDDPFTATDPERLEPLARILNEVARDTQIILLTCDYGDYRRAGLAPHREIDLERKL